MPYAEYHLGEAGSIGNAGGNTTTAALDTSGNGRHVNYIIGTSTIRTDGSGVFAPGSTSYADTSDAKANGWYARMIYTSLPTDNFAFGVYARAADLASEGTVFGLGMSGGFHIGLAANGWGAWVSNGSGGVTSWIGNANGTSGSFSANTWVHLALIRRGGISTFYIDGVAAGATSAVTPVHNTPHLSVNPGGAGAFDGHLDEARVVTFNVGATNDQIFAALREGIPPQSLADQTWATVPGKRYIVAFNLRPGAGATTLPLVSLNVQGAKHLLSQGLPTSLPADGTPAPFRVAFTADSAQTRTTLTLAPGAAPPVLTGFQVAGAIELIPATSPSAAQRAQIDRRYGMFIHFGINTFENQQCTDGTIPPSHYAPTGLDVDQWVLTAREAGMRHIVLTCKHHDGFCLWNSKWTTYDVAESPVPADVVAAAAAACAKYGIGFCVYYSLWDRHDSSYQNDAAYNQYMLRQLTELMTNYGPICELWLDGGWDKANTRWPNSEIYDLIKRLQPNCLVTTNRTIGSAAKVDHDVLPGSQNNGDPIRYFPNDFRSYYDLNLPKFPDPKQFTCNGQSYYLPFEATIALSTKDYWFYDTRDAGPKLLSTLANIYETATAQDNSLILNSSPDRSGVIPEFDRQRLIELRNYLGLASGVPMAKTVNGKATGTASAVWNNETDNYGPQKALDGDPDTRWASGPPGLTTATFDIDFGAVRSFDRMLIDEYEQSPGVGRIQAFRLQRFNGAGWDTFYTGSTCRRRSLHDFPRQNTSKVRLVIDQATDAPSIWEIQAIDSLHASTSQRPASNSSSAPARNSVGLTTADAASTAEGR
jgi:alpha-L-fucosidase